MQRANILARSDPTCPTDRHREFLRMLRRAFQCLTRLANPPVFVITIADGVARATKGTPPASWIHDCTCVATDFGISRGHIDGVRTLHGIALRFSPDICAASHQRFRNVLATHLDRR